MNNRYPIEINQLKSRTKATLYNYLIYKSIKNQLISDA